MARPRQISSPSRQHQAEPVLVAEQHLRKAIKAIQPTPTKPERRDQDTPALLDILFQEPSLPLSYDIPAVFFSDDYLTELAAYQIGQVNAMLMEELNLPDAFTDPGVMVLDISKGNSHYVQGLLKNIAFRIAERFGNAGADAFIDLSTKRFFQLTRDGLVGVDFDSNVMRDVYRQQVNWHQDNQALFGNPRVAPRYQTEASFWKKPTFIVLGCLPLVDMYDLAPMLCREKLVLPQPKSSYAVERIISGQKISTSQEEYWHLYKNFLTKSDRRGANATHSAMPPGEYRNLLLERQMVRDNRLRMLSAYTGRQRKTATEHEVLAKHYPLYFRLADELIQQAGAGTVSLVSPVEFLTSPDAEIMRKRICSEFTSISITANTDIGGNDAVDAGLPYGIAVDFTICAMAKASRPTTTRSKPATAEVWYLANPFGSELSLATISFTPPNIDAPFTHKAILPSDRNGYSFCPPALAKEYESWPSTVGIYRLQINGLMEKRGGALIDIEKRSLTDRMRDYFDPAIPWSQYITLGHGMIKRQSRFEPKVVRENALRNEHFDANKVRPYLFKPFDIRWCYYTPTRPIWHEARPELGELQLQGNSFLVVRSNQAVDDEGVPLFYTNLLGDSDLIRGHAYLIPTWFSNEHGKRTANISDAMHAYLKGLGITADMAAENAATMVHHHILAIGFAPAYLQENKVELGQGWPRIPFPGFDSAKPETIAEASAAFRASADLGGRVAALLLGEAAAPKSDLDDGPGGLALLREPVSALSKKVDDRQYKVNQKWGKLFREGAVLPSHGRLSVREYAADERRAIEAAARAMGVHSGAAYALLGYSTRDIYLSNQVYLANIPAKVWEFTVGGYQVLKKWLSYRETDVLGRPLTHGEIMDFSLAARRIAYLKLLGYHLNHNYTKIRDLHGKAGFSFTDYYGWKG